MPGWESFEDIFFWPTWKAVYIPNYFKTNQTKIPHLNQAKGLKEDGCVLVNNSTEIIKAIWKKKEILFPWKHSTRFVICPSDFKQARLFSYLQILAKYCAERYLSPGHSLLNFAALFFFSDYHFHFYFIKSVWGEQKKLILGREWDFSYGEKGKALNKCYLRGGGERGGKNTLLPKCIYIYLSALDLKLEYIQYSFLAKKSVYCEKAS